MKTKILVAGIVRGNYSGKGLYIFDSQISPMEGSHLRRKKTQVRGVGERRGIVLLAWDQSANASSLETHAQIKTPFREDPTLVTEVFQTWFPVLSYAFIMTHFAASSLRLLGCVR